MFRFCSLTFIRKANLWINNCWSKLLLLMRVETSSHINCNHKGWPFDFSEGDRVILKMFSCKHNVVPKAFFQAWHTSISTKIKTHAYDRCRKEFHSRSVGHKALKNILPGEKIHIHKSRKNERVMPVSNHPPSTYPSFKSKMWNEAKILLKYRNTRK